MPAPMIGHALYWALTCIVARPVLPARSAHERHVRLRGKQSIGAHDHVDVERVSAPPSTMAEPAELANPVRIVAENVAPRAHVDVTSDFFARATGNFFSPSPPRPPIEQRRRKRKLH